MVLTEEGDRDPHFASGLDVLDIVKQQALGERTSSPFLEEGVLQQLDPAVSDSISSPAPVPVPPVIAFPANISLALA